CDPWEDEHAVVLNRYLVVMIYKVKIATGELSWFFIEPRERSDNAFIMMCFIQCTVFIIGQKGKIRIGLHQILKDEVLILAFLEEVLIKQLTSMKKDIRYITICIQAIEK